MTVKSSMMNYALYGALPNVNLFQQLVPCPKCGAKHCIDAARRGPAVFMLTAASYRVICLNCWHKSNTARTEEGAIQNWNDGDSANRLAQLRKKHNLSQAKLAELAGVSAVTISKIERKDTNGSPATRRRIARALGVTIADI